MRYIADRPDGNSGFSYLQISTFKCALHKITPTMTEKSQPVVYAGRPGKEEIAFAEMKANITEKDILLSLANDITAVRDKKDILRLIHPKIKQLFDTDDIFICFLDT